MKTNIWKRKWFIALIIVLGVIVIAASVVLGIFWDLITQKPQESVLGTYYGLFGYAPMVGDDTYFIDYSNKMLTYKNEIEAGMDEDATDSEKVNAAYIIYRIACLSNATCLQKAKYSIGSGIATGSVYLLDNEDPIEVSGGMNLNATYYDLIYPFIKPSDVSSVYGDSYQSYGVSEEYTQIPLGAVTSNHEGLTRIGEIFLNSSLPFARRSIYDKTHKIVWSGNATTCVISEDKSVADFSAKSRNFRNFNYEEQSSIIREYNEDWGDEYGSTAKDLSIHIISPDTIIADTVQITEHLGTTINDDSIPFYTVKFEVDTETARGTENSATYFAEQLYLSEAPVAFTSYLSDYSMNYTYLKVDFSVFNNGYLRTWGTDETWEMRGEITGIATATVTSNNNSVEAFCYDYDTIMQGYVNRYFGDIDKVNEPKSALPFYDLISNIEAQEYGNYR